MKLTQERLEFLTLLSPRKMCCCHCRALDKYVKVGLLEIFGKTVKMVRITKVGRNIVRAAKQAALKAANDEFSCYLRNFS